MRIAILHNAVAADAPAADRDVLVQVEAVDQALRTLGHATETLPVTLDLGHLRDQLLDSRPDAVFNLVESLDGYDRLNLLPAAILDVLGIAYTGSPTEALLVSGDKVAAKQRLREANLPTPDWLTLDDCRRVGADLPATTAGTFIIKSAWQHASFGLDSGALVTGASLSGIGARLVDTSRRLGGVCFAEKYIDGREFNLSILEGKTGPEVLPPAEIDFSAFPDDKPRLVDERAKWEPDSFEYRNTPRTFDFPSEDRTLVERLGELAVEAWRTLGLKGYARVDFRVDGVGQPWILEVNANPCLSPDAGFYAAVERAGMQFADAVQRILGAMR